VKLALTVLAIAAALALQTTLTTFVRGTATLDFVLIVVVYLALTSGPTTGLVVGGVAGLIQDSLSSGILGVGGLGLKAVAGENGAVRHVPAITLSLTIDHQAVDGGPGARFLKALGDALASFELQLVG